MEVKFDEAVFIAMDFAQRCGYPSAMFVDALYDIGKRKWEVKVDVGMDLDDSIANKRLVTVNECGRVEGFTPCS